MIALLWIVFALIVILAGFLAYIAVTEPHDKWVPICILILALASAVVIGINNVQRHEWETENHRLQVEAIKAQAVKEYIESGAGNE